MSISFPSAITAPTVVTYQDIIDNSPNDNAVKLAKIILERKANVGVAADLSTRKEVIQLMKDVGGEVPLFKLHSDVIEDFFESTEDGMTTQTEFKRLADDLGFMIFEDAKVADIGDFNVKRVTKGPFYMSSYADFITIHALPGEAAVRAPALALKEKNVSILLLMEMSSVGNLFDENYRQKAHAIAKAEDIKNCIGGYIGQDVYDRSVLTFTPGISVKRKGDAKGQSYNTPEVVFAKGARLGIIGRDITEAHDRKQAALDVSEICWKAYEKAVGKA